MSLLLFASACSQKPRVGSDASRPYAQEFAKIRTQLISELPEIESQTDPLSIALTLRDYVHQEVKMDETPQGTDFFKFWENFELSVTGERSHLCGGIAVTYASALKAFGIPVRHVELYTNTTWPYSSHDTTEVLIDGRWILSGATFDVGAVDDEGHYIGIEEMIQRTTSGKPLLWDTGGFDPQPGRSVEDYDVPYSDLLGHVVFFPAEVETSSGNIKFDTQYFPNEFTGDLIGNDGFPVHLPPAESAWYILSSPGFAVRLSDRTVH